MSVEIVSIAPTRVWVERGEAGASGLPDGSLIVRIQHEGMPPFDAVRVNYDYAYFDNSLVRRLAEAIAAHIEGGSTLSGWREMNCAPKDGTRILGATSAGYVVPVQWNGHDKVWRGNTGHVWSLVVWMPMPKYEPQEPA